MNRTSLFYLRPYLRHATNPHCKSEAARAYCAIQKRFISHHASDEYLGPPDVEKHKRLDQLRNVKPLDTYHPRLGSHDSSAPLSIRDFVSKYDHVQETYPDRVSVFGME